MTDAFGRCIESLLGPHGLVVYDSSDPAAKPLARHVFAHELAASRRTTARLAAKAGQALVAAGYHAQVTTHEDAVSLFHLNDGREPRSRCRQPGNRWQPPDNAGRFR